MLLVGCLVENFRHCLYLLLDHLVRSMNIPHFDQDCGLVFTIFYSIKAQITDFIKFWIDLICFKSQFSAFVVPYSRSSKSIRTNTIQFHFKRSNYHHHQTPSLPFHYLQQITFIKTSSQTQSNFYFHYCHKFLGHNNPYFMNFYCQNFPRCYQYCSAQMLLTCDIFAFQNFNGIFQALKTCSHHHCLVYCPSFSHDHLIGFDKLLKVHRNCY